MQKNLEVSDFHEGETAPEECPLCFVGPEDFVEVTEEEA